MQSKRENRLEIKKEVQRLFNKRLFYSNQHPEWKEVLRKALNYKKTFCPADKDPQRSANRMVTDQFKQCVQNKPKGRPQKYAVQNANKKVLQFILRVSRKKVTQLTINRTTYWRIRKRIIDIQTQSNKRVISMKLPNYNLCIDSNEDYDIIFQKGYKIETLKQIDKDKKYPCYGCHSRIHKLQGKPCENINCFNPLIIKRKNHQLQFHEECLIILDWNSIAVCACCAYAMYIHQYQFPSGNKFINEYQQLSTYKPIGIRSINNNNIIFFKGYIDGNPNEYYFIRNENALLMQISNPIAKKYIIWNNQYRIPSQRDVYQYNELLIKGFQNDKYKNLSLQYLQNKYNDYIPSWMAINNFSPIPQIIDELINVILRDLWDNTDKDRRRNIESIGPYYDNAKLSIQFINYSYKVIVHRSVESQLKSQPKNKTYKKILNDEFQIFEISGLFF